MGERGETENSGREGEEGRDSLRARASHVQKIRASVMPLPCTVHLEGSTCLLKPVQQQFICASNFKVDCMPYSTAALSSQFPSQT